ncbi:MAG: His/Gly/Thr/Pro-type tRNA ligase C-terminal domain-containing protein [Candidatus Komeilibacteria bacterium]|nr:His/Gly/Thr/Pro-type tRNA ligase C-terminal domain-containing protein [Candidatus Komeilibacteria bacterium]
MKQSKLFGKTLREAPKDEVSANAILLSRAGFIHKLMAGVYSYLPLGFRVLDKIKNIVREEMNALGGQEILMPALTPKELWQETGRWEKLKEIMFQFAGAGDQAVGLAATHEEVLVNIVRRYLSSYRDLPLYLYQIQDKFRNEPRAKSGLLRGREFSMKDLYSFHENQADLDNFYQQAIGAYQKVFERCGLISIVTEASGGAFTTEYSHEFQVATPYGEDEIMVCSGCGFAQNREICAFNDGAKCPSCAKAKLAQTKSIEVGNIFKLGTIYSKPMQLTFTGADGKEKEVIMGCYGLGPSRVMGSVAEVHHDKDGLIWPKEITPFHAHLLLLDNKQAGAADKLYRELTFASAKGGSASGRGWEILFDERVESSGAKLKDADLIGISLQLIIGAKSAGAVEYRFRDKSENGKVNFSEVDQLLKKFYR